MPKKFGFSYITSETPISNRSFTSTLDLKELGLNRAQLETVAKSNALSLSTAELQNLNISGLSHAQNEQLKDKLLQEKEKLAAFLDGDEGAQPISPYPLHNMNRTLSHTDSKRGISLRAVLIGIGLVLIGIILGKA